LTQYKVPAPYRNHRTVFVPILLRKQPFLPDALNASPSPSPIREEDLQWIRKGTFCPFLKNNCLAGPQQNHHHSGLVSKLPWTYLGGDIGKMSWFHAGSAYSLLVEKIESHIDQAMHDAQKNNKAPGIRPDPGRVGN